MDPVCHTLVGASLGATGLARKTRFGTTTLIVAANLPDVDAITYFGDGAAAYALRRGVTHGLPALVVLPVVLAAVMTGITRLKPSADRDASFRWLLLLSAIGVWSHPSLDWLNTYGMRWLMPIANRWFYGDTLFIMDWVVWLALITGLVATWVLRGRSLGWFQRPAAAALAFVIAYIGANFVLTRIAMREALAAAPDDPPRRVMASPVPFNPLRREIVFEYDEEYRLGRVRFAPGPRFEPHPEVIAKGDTATLERAREQLAGRQFLSWARFPYTVVEQTDGGTVLWVADARYVTDPTQRRLREFGAVRLELP